MSGHTQHRLDALIQGKEIRGDCGHELIATINGMPVTICEVPLSSVNSMDGAETVRISKAESVANVRRLADCWNACEGMADPVAEIERLRDLVRSAGAKLRQMARELNGPYFNDRYGDGPTMQRIADACAAAIANAERQS